MNFINTQFDPALLVLAWGIWLPLLLWSVLRARWRCLSQEGRIHFWLGATVVLMLLWRFKAGVQPGLDLHLLGANLLMLAFGPELAFLSINLLLAGHWLNSDTADSWAFALNALQMGALPVWVAYGLWRCFTRWLPPQVFVFIFVNGFFSAGLTLVSVGLSGTALLALSEQYTLAYLVDEYLPYFFLLAFSESWLNGMVVTLLVVYRPEWLTLFDAERYFRYSDRRR